MKKAIMTEPGKIELKNYPVPEIQEDEILVKVQAVGICTWEQKYFKGVPGSYPFNGGHEICGVVEKIGSGTNQKFKKGDKVVVAGLTRCGECYYCRRGLDNLCENSFDAPVSEGQVWGPGGFSEYIAAKSYWVYKIDKDIDYAIGTLAEPLACSIRSLDRSNLQYGDTAVVLGGGVMGILHLLLAKLKGVYVIVSEPDQKRRQNALSFGADMVVDPLSEDLKKYVQLITDNRGAEAVFFTAGGTPALEQGITLLVNNGVLVVYGGITPSVPVKIDPMLFHYSEINLTGVTKHSKETFRKASEIINRRLIPLENLISKRYPYSQIEEGFRRGMELDTYRVILEF